MADLLMVLKDARGWVERDWGSSDPDCLAGSGAHCASIAIAVAAFHVGASVEVEDEAHRAFVRATWQEPERGRDAMHRQVYAFNDAQSSPEPVLRAFDRAIAAESTPNADAALEVMAACDQCAEVVARHIVSEHPGMDLVEAQQVASAELFYAAQDTAWAFDLGVEVPR